MASKQLSTLATCDIHVDRKANAMCLKHHELLCVKCILQKPKSDDCNFIDIQDIEHEREQCILEYLCARQTVKQLGEDKCKQLSQAQDLKEKLLNEIGDLHKECSSRLDKMRETCEKSVNENARCIEQHFIVENKFLDEKELLLNSNLEKLKDEDVNFNECFEQLMTIQKDIFSHAGNDKMFEVEGSFTPDEDLEKCLKKESLGLVQLIHQQRYEDVAHRDDPKNASAQKKRPDDEAEQITGSDHVIYSGVNIAQKNPGEVTDQKTEVRETPKQTRRRRGRFSFFKGRTNNDKDESTATKSSITQSESELANVALAENAEVPIPQSKSLKLQSMANKKMKIPDFDSASVEPGLKFTKLVHLGEGCIGLLADSTVVVTELPDGPTLSKQFLKQVSSIVSTGCREIAVLSGEQINVLGIHGRKLTMLGSCVIQETITDVTGFDFDVKTSRYAVSTFSKVLILDKRGKLIKSCTISHPPTVDASNFRSVYDFNAEQVIYLNVHLRTLRAIKCNKAKAVDVWKKKCGEETFIPKDICLYNDLFCVASRSSIATFLKTNGKPVALHETYDILSDCLAVCVRDDIAMWTSGTDDSNLSTNIGFVPL